MKHSAFHLLSVLITLSRISGQRGGVINVANSMKIPNQLLILVFSTKPFLLRISFQACFRSEREEGVGKRYISIRSGFLCSSNDPKLMDGTPSFFNQPQCHAAAILPLSLSQRGLLFPVSSSLYSYTMRREAPIKKLGRSITFHLLLAGKSSTSSTEASRQTKLLRWHRRNYLQIRDALP